MNDAMVFAAGGDNSIVCLDRVGSGAFGDVFKVFNLSKSVELLMKTDEGYKRRGGMFTFLLYLDTFR